MMKYSLVAIAALTIANAAGQNVSDYTVSQIDQLQPHWENSSTATYTQVSKYYAPGTKLTDLHLVVDNPADVDWVSVYTDAGGADNGRRTWNPKTQTWAKFIKDNNLENAKIKFYWGGAQVVARHKNATKDSQVDPNVKFGLRDDVPTSVMTRGITANEAGITTNATGIAGNKSAEQIKTMAVSGSSLTTTQVDGAGGNNVVTTDMSGLVTTQGTTNASNIQANTAAEQITGQTLTNNKLETVQLDGVGGTHTVSTDLTGLETVQGNRNAAGISNNAGSIVRNTGNIATNAVDINTNKTDIGTNKDTITHNAGGIVDGKTILSNKDLSNNQNVIGSQVTTNTGNIQTNTKDIKVNKDNISTNAGNIATNTGNIKVNAGNIDRNWQSIQFNSQNIDYLTDWNTQQDGRIDDLYGVTNNMQGQINDLNEYTTDAVAGLTALSAVDFGSLAPGENEVGGGIGVASGADGSNGFAGAVGLKHQFTEETAGIIKGWAGSNSNMGASIGGTYRF